MRQKIKLTPQEATALQSSFRSWSLEARAVEEKQLRARRLHEKAAAIESEARTDHANADAMRNAVIDAFLKDRIVELGPPVVSDMRIDGNEFSFEDGRTEERFDAFLRAKEDAKKKAETEAGKKTDEKLLEDAGRELASKSKNGVGAS